MDMGTLGTMGAENIPFKILLYNMTRLKHNCSKMIESHSFFRSGCNYIAVDKILWYVRRMYYKIY
jgi:hypothetical protein